MLAALALARDQAGADLHESFFRWIFEVQREAATNHTCDQAWHDYQTARDHYDALQLRVQEELTA